MRNQIEKNYRNSPSYPRPAPIVCCARVSKVHGLKDLPITIRGAGAAEESVVQGTGVNDRVFELYHNYYILEVRRISPLQPEGGVAVTVEMCFAGED